MSTVNANSIGLIDLGAEYRDLNSDLLPAVERVLASGIYILGPETAAFEKSLSSLHQGRPAVGVNSGTDALVLGLRALNIGAGDEVIVPAFSFFATAEAVCLVGAEPVFADIDPKTFTLDADDARRRITPRTKALIAVHLYGHAADMTKLTVLADEVNLRLIEDNAQALGATWRGQSTGTFADIAAMSFFPTKNLGACGDAGAVVCGTPELAAHVRRLRQHGSDQKYIHEEIGYNSRLDEVQAAVLRVKLSHWPRWTQRRRQIADRYHAGLSGLPLDRPAAAPEAQHVFHLFTIQTDCRNELRAFLEARGISAAVHYPVPMHRQKAFAGSPGVSCPIAEGAARRVLSLPLHPYLTDEQADRVVAAIREFYASS